MLVKMMMMIVNMGSPLVAAQLGLLLFIGKAVVVGPLVAGLGFLFLSTVILAVA